MADVVLKFPTLPQSATLDDALKQMRAHNVSATVIQYSGAHYLVPFDAVVRKLRTKSPRTEKIGVLVGGSALPRVNTQDLQAWFAESGGSISDAPAAPAMPRYALVNVTNLTADIAFQFDAFNIGGSPPVLYECSVDPANHNSYDASEVGNPPRCPDPTHRSPRPRARLMV